MVVGHGEFRYIVNIGWGQLDPSVTPVNDCHEMVQDSQGRILLLTNEPRNHVVIYDKSGRFIESWGTEYPGAHGLTLSRENGEDFLFICDNQRHQVIKTTLSGKEVMVLDYPKQSGVYDSAEQYIPTEVAVAPNGDFYVADGYGLDWIIQYDHNGQYVRHFGGKGTGIAQLNNAHGVCVDVRHPEDPVLWATSRPDHTFKRFSMSGVYQDQVHLPGAWVCRPVIHGTYLYAAVLVSEKLGFNGGSGFITILDKDNRVVSNPGGLEPTYKHGHLQEMCQAFPIFQYPHDVCVDDDQNLYVPQWNSGKVYPYKLERI
ncbi:MAG TPA: 6-bladed beta-propeller [Bacteroidetes bacterium]|nr:6-bladed beta-propeller [Bacteroidota bacterium]